MITFVQKGNFKNTEAFLERNKNMQIQQVLSFYAQKGVEALREATPKDTGQTAESWDYEIVKDASGYKIYWTNTANNKGVQIAILIQYGHGTGTGGYVQGRDFINPAIRPIFDEMAEIVWKEVTR